MNTINNKEENTENANIIKDEEDCDTCGNKVYYSVVYDAYFCKVCDNWLENACGDKQCEFCSVRPEKPSELKIIQ